MEFDGFQVFKSISSIYRQNTYIVQNKFSGNSVVIDPGDEPEKVLAISDGLGGKVLKILLTHGHFDHIGAVNTLNESWGTKALIHSGDNRLLKRAPLFSIRFIKKLVEPPKEIEFLDPSSSYIFEGTKIEFLPTPGHTHGSCCIVFPGFVFTGDLLFHESIGPSNPPDGNSTLLNQSISFLLSTLPENYVILPGHGKPWNISDARTWWALNAKTAQTYQIFPTR